MNSKHSILCPPDKWCTDHSTPIVYLSGSMNKEYHEEAMQKLENFPILIASPYNGPWSLPEDHIYTHDQYQLMWELAHIRLASANGIILCWLDQHSTFKDMWEAGEWVQNWKHRKITTPDNTINLVLGLSHDFNQQDYILARIASDCPDLPITNSITDACDIAMKIIMSHVLN